MTTSAIILWVYILLLVAGGLMGYLKAGSKPSLIASSAFALALVLCQVGLLPLPHAAEVLLGLLLVVFVMRLAKTKKFMPSGLMLAVTALTLALRVCL